ncbi:MAG: hypothetical protein JF565_01535 [Propionibacteriales bacterium]|nr:hypothetical protein [Propionibacteriales bacterium]
MLRWVRRLLATGLCTLLLCGGLEAAAHAGVARVSGVHVGAQNRCAATMRVKWRAVKGASYQVRWASSKSRLAAANLLSVGHHVASVGPLSVSGPSFIQVRAVRQGKPGAWSKIGKGRFSSARFGQPCALSGHGVPGGVEFTWNATPGASAYRVRWAAAPFGKWPDTASYVSGWLPGTARASDFAVPVTPQSGDHMLGVAYANPIWGQLEARNKKGTVRRSQGWQPVFPAPPDPGAGDPLRVGTYNTMLDPTGARAQVIAENIRSHGLGVAALQESGPTSAPAIAAALGAGWDYAPKGAPTPQTIVYRSSAYRLLASGAFYVANPKQPSTPIDTPWALLQPVNGSAHSQAVYVVSMHVTEDPNKSVMDRKRDAGLMAQSVMDEMNRINTAGRPVIVAGDLHYLREPFTDTPGYVEAPPTLVRGGYYDAMAAVSKTNVGYQTFNGGNGTTAPHQDLSQSGVAPRADYIMLKGFRGSNAYVNVANWSLNGVTPSDHNLVYADVTVPFAP